MVFGSGGRRRAFLAGVAGAATATAGCLGNVRNLLGRQGVDQLSLSIATLPASEDPYAVRIATRLADNLRASGIETMVDPVRPDVLFRDILINQDFDLYVARYPSHGAPDELRSMLYSPYAEESGWQNPFGFTDLTLDDLLDQQRSTEGADRIGMIHEIQRRVVREQPFTVVCFPDHLGAVRDDRFDGWPPGGPGRPPDYFRLHRVGSETTLQLLLGNDRITRNRNPIAVEYRDQGKFTGLLYDPLVWPGREDVEASPDPIPWLARTVAWEGDETLSATVQVRETPWHDGEPVTAEDVAFTYEFLGDTSLGEFETPVPTPWRRGRVSLVDATDVLDDRRIRIAFTTRNRSIARRALVVPILPRHIWRERTDPADIAGIELGGPTTQALVASNEAAVGSGPLQFVDGDAGESLSLEAFPDHFLYTGRNENIPDRLSEERPFDRIEFTVAPSHDAVVQILSDDGADAAADGLRASVVPRIVRDDDVSLTTRATASFYHIGYNCRRAPLVDPNFRRTIARHIHRETAVLDSLEGYGIPSEAPLKGQWVPDNLLWDGEANLPFFGTDGEFDEEAAMEAFQEAGYQYDGDRLIRRETT
jgi:peptide/nickel transport system substrate-binding protein